MQSKITEGVGVPVNMHAVIYYMHFVKYPYSFITSGDPGYCFPDGEEGPTLDIRDTTLWGFCDVEGGACQKGNIFTWSTNGMCAPFVVPFT